MEEPSIIPSVAAYIVSIILFFAGSALLVNLVEKMTRKRKKL